MQWLFTPLSDGWGGWMRTDDWESNGPEQEAVGWRFLAQLTCFDNFFDLDLIWCPTAIVRNAISICTSFEPPEFYRGIKLRPVGSCWAIVQERCVFVKHLRVVVDDSWLTLLIYISDIIWLRFVCRIAWTWTSFSVGKGKIWARQGASWQKLRRRRCDQQICTFPGVDRW